MTAAHHDFETRSAVDLRKTGAYVYAEHPSTAVWCMSWRIGDKGPVERWHPGDEDPLELLIHVANGGRMIAHNAAFERLIWNVVVRRKYCPHWPELKIEQQDCTMSRAAALHLPQGLDQLGIALGLKQQKDKEGSALMLQMAKPRKRNPDGTFTWWDLPEKIARLGDYCDQDVRTETDADLRMAPLSPYERRVWEWDQAVNDRGIFIDAPMVERAIEVVEHAQGQANARMSELTGGEIKKASEAAKIVAWLNARGIVCTSIAKGEQAELLIITDVIGDDLARQVIELRAEAAKAATAKLRAMINCAGGDSRARGLLVYHGAATGRWTGKLIQPHNLPRVDEETQLPDVLTGFGLMEACADPADAFDAMELAFGPPLPVLGRSLRGMLCAPPGKKLVGGDFSNVEGRVNAWMAGEQWKLDAFRAYDEGTGHDLYKLAYAKSFGTPVLEVAKPQRQIGKVQELALGYQGSIGAFISMGANYNVKPSDIVKTIRPLFEGTDVWCKLMLKFEQTPRRFRYDLSAEQWVSIKIVVDGWRDGHPQIVQTWWDVQDAAIEAVMNPQTMVSVCNGRVRYMAAKGFLWCCLPSGRVLAYARPRIVETANETFYDADGEEIEAPGSKEEREIALLMGDMTVEQGRAKRVVQFDGINQKTRRWGTHSLYGGLQWNNIVQGTARDLLMHAGFAVESCGYPVVLHVHDELVSEVSEAFGSAADFQAIMSQLPEWAHGLPLSAAAWEDRRYVK